MTCRCDHSTICQSPCRGERFPTVRVLRSTEYILCSRLSYLTNQVAEEQRGAQHAPRQLPAELRSTSGVVNKVQMLLVCPNAHCFMQCDANLFQACGCCVCLSAHENAKKQVRDLPTSISFEGCGAAISYHLAAYDLLQNVPIPFSIFRIDSSFQGNGC